ncbi:hypothetical protein KAW65_08810 [candidate division WOR-3 bacterium]|nr:hypothetical protein [candidate division WOR-3 bacterium]
MKRYFAYIVILLFIGCSEKSPKESEFKPPEDGKITPEMVDAYVNASKYLMEAIALQEKEIEKFVHRHKIGDDLSEFSDSTYCNKHPQVLKAWQRLQERWSKFEFAAYKKAPISEAEFNWIGGALTDTVNKAIQIQIAQKLKEIIRE